MITKIGQGELKALEDCMQVAEPSALAQPHDEDMQTWMQAAGLVNVLRLMLPAGDNQNELQVTVVRKLR